jgi:hypothetical protein
MATLGQTVLSVFDTVTTYGMVPTLIKSINMLVKRFFPNTVTFEEQQIALDYEVGLRTMAPFAHPLLESPMVEDRQIITNLVTPAFISDKRTPDIRRPIQRALGERIMGGDFTPVERAAMNVAYNIKTQKEMTDRRLEWMAAKTLQDGFYVIKAVGVPTTLINFNRHPSLTVLKSGATAWTQANIGTVTTPGSVSPSNDIEDMNIAMNLVGGGSATDLVCGSKAYQALILDPKLQHLQISAFMGSSLLQNNPLAEFGLAYRGMLGPIRVWVYTEWFVDSEIDENGVKSPTYGQQLAMIDPRKVILVNGNGEDGIDGLIPSNIILDAELNFPKGLYNPKLWYTPGYGNINLLMRSSCLVYPKRPNASASIQVI